MATIYPPILNSSLEAFIYSTDPYKVYFSLPSLTTINEINHIQIRVVELTNNKSIVDTNKYPDGIIYKGRTKIVAKDATDLNYYVNIESEDLAETWKQGVLYKILLRFGENDLWDGSLENFANWKNESIVNNSFSEWSTVMIIKAIDLPVIEMKNLGSVANSTKEDNTYNAELTTTPIFYGSYSIPKGNDEYVDKYKFDLYLNGTLLETSGWLLHDSGTTLLYDTTFLSEYNIEITDKVLSFDTHRFKTTLTNFEEYSVNYSILTINGYKGSLARTYDFMVTKNYLTRLNNVELLINSTSHFCKENACILISLTSTFALSGNYVLTRTSEASNYTVWDDIKYFLFLDNTFDETLIFTDYTIESGIKYQYAFLLENDEGFRTSPLYLYPTTYHSVDFLSNYLYADGVLLKLDYNFQISSFKHTVLASKQDTLGSKYATILRNGNAYYAEFPISGLISLHMDKDNTFFTFNEKEGYYYNDDLIIPYTKYLDGEINTYNSNLTDNNFFIEKRFRDKVEEFLNDGGYKLYRSASEGNIIVTLINISLKPNASLGRMLYEFSATAYEVLEFNLENLNEYGLINIGAYRDFEDDDTEFLLAGLIEGLYTGKKDSKDSKKQNTNPDNLVSLIRADNEYSIGGGYRYDFRKLKCIWVEQYPKLDYKYKIIGFQAAISEAKKNGEDYSDLETLLKYYQKLVTAVENEPTYPIVTLFINDKEVSLGRNKVYNLENLDEEITSIYLKFTGPVVVNYVCRVGVSADESSGVVTSIVSTKFWGLIAGMFTDTDIVLKKYNYNYANYDYRIENLMKDVPTNFDVFNKINILDIIKEETKKLVESKYNTKFTNYNEETDQWDNGKLYYVFNDIISIEIESEIDTILEIKRPNSDEIKEIVIGPSYKYRLNPADDLISYLAFKKPTYAIINYRTLTNLMTVRNTGD